MPAANDVAARHDEVDTVGFVRLLRQMRTVITVHPDANFFAAGDDTAVDGFCAVFLVQHPQAIGNFAGICLVCQKVIDEQDEKRRKATLQASYNVRMLLQAVWITRQI